MDAKARTPTKAAQTQIAKLLRRAFDGPPQFLAIDRIKEWFGRLDDDANKKLREAWKEQVHTKRLLWSYAETSDWRIGQAERLYSGSGRQEKSMANRTLGSRF